MELTIDWLGLDLACHFNKKTLVQFYLKLGRLGVCNEALPEGSLKPFIVKEHCRTSKCLEFYWLGLGLCFEWSLNNELQSKSP